MMNEEEKSWIDRMWTRIKIDWWEVTNLGYVGYLRFAWDWLKFLLGFKKYKPNLFSYSEIDFDLNFDFSKDEKDNGKN